MRSAAQQGLNLLRGWCPVLPANPSHFVSRALATDIDERLVDMAPQRAQHQRASYALSYARTADYREQCADLSLIHI